ncbi:MAG: N-acetylmuramoyl-L-alanine amidase [Dongiaceae bacterium]
MPSQPIPCPSPNHDARPAASAIDILLLHYTGMPSAEAALARLCDPTARVSAHYLIDEDGTAYALVPEERRAWHAGVSFWAGARDINARSIGIEIVNPGHEFGYRPFPEPQMVALEQLVHSILARHPIPAHRVLGHSDVAPARKIDPGELFPWERLAQQGIGLWPSTIRSVQDDGIVLGRHVINRNVWELQAALGSFGYEIEATGSYDDLTRTIVIAFQRHFQPEVIGTHAQGFADGGTMLRINSLCWRKQVLGD